MKHFCALVRKSGTDVQTGICLEEEKEEEKGEEEEGSRWYYWTMARST